MPRLQTSRPRVPRNAWRTGSAGRLTRTALATLVICLALCGRVRHVVVAGASMRPTLEPGDRLVTLRTPWRPRPGGLALAADPRVPDRLLIKRVHAVDGDGVDLRGDATSGSTDSRTFGLVPLDAVESCVAFRYHPIERAGGVSSWRARAVRRGRRRRARR